MSDIVVIGSANTDMVVKTSRFPEPGETIIGGDFFMFPGGKGANQAVAAARLGGKVSFISKVGADVFGTQSKEGFIQENINIDHLITDPNHPSGVALITVNAEGENEIVVASGANAHLTAKDIDQASSLIASANIILTQLEIPIKTVGYLIQLSKDLDKKLILNPAPAQGLEDESLDGLYCITPNQTEAELITGIKVDSKEQANQAANYLLEKGVKHVVITMGAHGSFYKSKTEQFFIKADTVKAIDTTAAGDVYNGALATGLSVGRSWRDAIILATKAAGISVTRMGAQASAPMLEEIV